VACFLPVRAKDLSTPPRIIFSDLKLKKARYLYVIDGLIKSNFLLSRTSVAGSRYVTHSVVWISRQPNGSNVGVGVV
jgi:hypothetical protein